MNRSTRVWIRRATTVTMVVLLVTVAVLAVLRGRRSIGLPRFVTGEGVGPRVRDLATDFRIEETDAGRLIFELAAERTVGDQSGWYEIEGVRLKLHPKEGEGPVLSCQSASVNVETRDARLRGAVQVEFPSGGLLTTDAGRFDNKSRSFMTDGGVVYADGLTIGRAGRASYSLEDDRLVLADGVVVRDERGVQLRAPRVLYSRAEGRVVVPEGCRLQLEESLLEASNGMLQLDGEGSVESLELWDGVTGRSAAGPDGATLSMEAERLTARREGGGNWQLAAATSGPWIRATFVGGESFHLRELTTLALRGVMGEAGLEGMRAEQGVCLREVPLSGPPRSAEADSARMWFEQGRATDVELDGGVTLVAEGATATGHRARVSALSRMVMIHGHPVQPDRTTLISDRGRLSADQLLMHDADGRIEARGSVQGEIFDVKLLGGEAGAAPSSMHFAAGLLEVTESGAAFRLRDGARAWQDRRLLLADDIRYRQDLGRLEANGHVRTTLPAAQLESDSSASGDVVVVSRALEYDREHRSAQFQGMVRYSDPTYTLGASSLEANFDQDDRLTEIEARGAVEIEDLERGWRMTGQVARRNMATQIVSLTGEPAQLRDEKGNAVSGPSLTWDQASGTVTVAGGSETIYYPEETP